VKRIVGLLGWLGVLLVVVAVVLRFSRPDVPQWSQRMALAGLVVTVLYALTQWREIVRSFGGRNVRYGSMAATSVVLVLGILVAVNWIANRQNKRWDLTAGSQFSLSDQTRQILNGLEQPVTIRVFYVGSAEEHRDRLDEYAYVSSQVNVQYVDADRNPLDAQKYSVTSVPTLILEYAGRTERATATDEQSVTNALKKVVEGKAKKVYFTQGHGELDPAGSGNDSYRMAADALRTDNFEVATLTIAQEGKIPDDATLLVVAGPTTDLLPAEVDAIRTFLSRGGKLLLMVDPPEKDAGAPVTNVVALAREWGIEIGTNIVIDASGLGQLFGTDASVPVAMPVDHPITNNFRVMTAFPLARSVTPVEGGVDGRTARDVLQTSAQSWAESDVAGVYTTGRPERNLDRGDLAGPVSIAAAVSIPAPNAPAPETAEAPKPESRVVVVGDSDFATDRAISIQGNREIFLNMANWLAQQEDLIAIRPRNPEDRPINVTADQGRMVWIFTLLVLPALLFLNGVRVWWRRR
jgi:ABC-type uncharacterized transport system involved in gliding motility auxiliary subunit